MWPLITTLRNGALVPHAVVLVTTMNLREVAKSNPNALLDLFAKCRDSRYQISKSSQLGSNIILKKLRLIDHKGNMDHEVREVVLNSIEIRGNLLKLVDPRQIGSGD